jgi:predicted 3-demethylubiquinone-9 3-methyltransferase (glyoxalase superfamily)
MVTIDLLDQEFTLISAGPLFKFNPSISFLVARETKDEINTLWEKLSLEGEILMELGEYPFSEKYGWIRDKFGVSWQIMYTTRKIQQFITPTLMFIGDNWGKAENAIDFYTSVFRDSEVGDILRYDADEEPDKEGTIKHAAFTLEGQEFAAMDSARPHDFTFNEAISFMVKCKNQEEIDYYWEKLSAVPEAEQCGWLKDKYGLSWQIVPSIMDKMMKSSDEKKFSQVTEAFLKMKKFDIATLEKAYAR